MAVTLWARTRTITSVVSDSFTEAQFTSPTSGLLTSTTLIARDTDTKEWTSIALASQYHPTWIGWRVNAVGTEFTLSGNITFKVQCFASVANAGRVHVELYKRTAGGSDVVSLIAQGDAGIDITTSSGAHTMTVTPPAPVTLAHGERLLYRIFVKRRSADFDTATFSLRYNHTATGVTNFALTETATFLPDTVILYARRTSVAGIGNFFDLLPTMGVTTSTTGVVNTTASGTEIQWTRTAGGTVLEWISPRFKGPWSLTPGPQFGILTGLESNIAANCSVRWKLFRWRAGTETLALSNSYGSELTTTAARVSLPADGSPSGTTTFTEDDRIVARAYIINFGTMGGSRTCTISYDHDVALGIGESYMPLADMAEFKTESDPAGGPAASGLATMGLGT